MVTPFMNEDVLMDIFSRLPAKSVGKFRCLSKSWCTNLSTSQFINLHLITRKNKQCNIIFRNYDKSVYVVTLSNKDDAISRKVKLPRALNAVVDSYNGLVLWLRSQFDMVLVNHITLQHVTVKISSRFLKLIPTENVYFKCGFGYDSCSGDYKIVMYNWSGVNHGTNVEVYSLRSKVWKTVNTCPQHPITDSSHIGVFTNGAIHWASYDNSRQLRIVAFNLADEVFYDIPSPASASDWNMPFYRVYVLEGCLCVVDTSCNDIWIMKEYGVEASWTKFSVNLNGNWDIMRPLGFIGDEEIALLTYSNKVIVYNLVEGTSKVIVVGGIQGYPFDGVAFYGSLISPN